MRVVSVNVGYPRLVPDTAHGDFVSGIYKLSIEGQVMIRSLNLDGDGQGDPINHGGPDAAVYVYASDDYAYWAQRLKRDLPTGGFFGENLTIEEALSEAMCFGDIWRVGTAPLRVTELRSPSYKLDHKLGIRNFAARFRKSGRVGFYNRVLEEGSVETGDKASLVETHTNPISIRLLNDGRHTTGVSIRDLERVLAAPDMPNRQLGYARRRLDKALTSWPPRRNVLDNYLAFGFMLRI